MHSDCFYISGVTKINLKKLEFGMSTDLLMTW